MEVVWTLERLGDDLAALHSRAAVRAARLRRVRRECSQTDASCCISAGSSTRQTTSRRLPSTSVYSIADPSSADTKETTLERLRRLRSEVAELEEDVKREQSEAEASPAVPAPTEGDSATAKGKGKKREVSPAVLLQQLQLLRGDLGELKVGGAEEGVLEGEGEKEEGGALAEKARSSKGLLEKLGQPATNEAADGAASTSAPPKLSAKEAVKDGELEKRLAELERVLGANEADVDEVRLLLFLITEVDLTFIPFLSPCPASTRRPALFHCARSLHHLHHNHRPILSLHHSFPPSPASTTSSRSSLNLVTSTPSPGA